MEIKRKEQNVRMATKDTQLIESEKRLLQEKLNDAETAMTGAARLVVRSSPMSFTLFVFQIQLCQ